MVSYDFQKFCENKQDQESLILEQFNDVCFQIAVNEDSVESFFREVVLPILESGKVFNSDQLMSIINEDAVERYLQRYGSGQKDAFDRVADPLKKGVDFARGLPGAAYNLGKRGLDAARGMFASKPDAAPEAAPAASHSPEQQQAIDMLNQRLPEVKKSFIDHIDKITKDVMDDSINLAGTNKMGGRVSWIAARSLGNQLKSAIQNWNPNPKFGGGPTGFSAAMRQNQGEKANMTRRLAQMDQPAGYDARKDPANVFGPKASSAPAAASPMSTPAVPSAPAMAPSDAGRKSPLFVPRSRTDMAGRPAVKGQDFMRR